LQKSKTNQVRINGGLWRSRLLKFPDVDGLRPTPERVRQTVFNWLGQELTGKTCLDLFAGTGAFGFEALSRNAKEVTLIENAHVAFKALKHNQILLNAQNSEILNQDAYQFLGTNTQKFDVIFCDPPFQKQWLDKLLPVLNKHLSTEGILYVEAEFELKSSELWQVYKQGKAGNVFYHLLKSA
jgi:16S rRNA (guanine(966)-N(2))-methyltransferase RsmD